MNDYIVRWSGDCHIEAVSPEEAVAKMKAIPQVIVACSSFTARDLIEDEKKDVAEVRGERR